MARHGLERGSPALGGWVCSALVVAALAGGCAGDGTDVPGATGGGFAELQARVFDTRCALGPCHSSGVAAGGLVLESAFAFEELVAATPTNDAARAAGLLRVAPGEPERSFLWWKLTSPQDGQGSRMPLGGEPLSEGELAEIRAWILAGAPPPGV